MQNAHRIKKSRKTLHTIRYIAVGYDHMANSLLRLFRKRLFDFKKTLANSSLLQFLITSKPKDPRSATRESLKSNFRRIRSKKLGSSSYREQYSTIEPTYGTRGALNEEITKEPATHAAPEIYL